MPDAYKMLLLALMFDGTKALVVPTLHHFSPIAYPLKIRDGFRGVGVRVFVLDPAS